MQDVIDRNRLLGKVTTPIRLSEVKCTSVLETVGITTYICQKKSIYRKMAARA